MANFVQRYGLIYKQVEATTDLEQTAPVGHDHSEGHNFDGLHDDDKNMTPEGPRGSPAGDLGYRYSIAGFQAIKDPEERALYANKWLFGDEIDAVHDELFGRQPTETAYSSNSGMMQQWAANVSKEEGKYES
ncbi:hypothetical protein A0H81_09469 [Grifola frondosa]|uniref:Uncharacterized protein n=1 Tax=Grifola frondosa TaxID=5627 RepID=A0A1C7M0R5_GRIFR|nr:hypothetical protein A0H81_09469 [Grifola frondosa]